MKCPLCGDVMEMGNINFSNTMYTPVLWFWWCKDSECGYWVPCDTKGDYPERPML